MQPGSMSMNLVANREIQERIRQARGDEMVRMSKGRRVRKLSFAGLKPAQMLSALRAALAALAAPRATVGRQVAEG